MTTAQFCKLIADAGFEWRWYSGHSMYGKECVAISAETMGDMLWMISEISQDSGNDHLPGIFRRAQYDNMGTGFILYFPNFTK